MKIDKGQTNPALLGNGPGAGPKKSKESDGDVANRIANVNAPAGTKPARVVSGKGSPNLDKDAFFKLMMTVLVNKFFKRLIIFFQHFFLVIVT